MNTLIIGKRGTGNFDMMKGNQPNTVAMPVKPLRGLLEEEISVEALNEAIFKAIDKHIALGCVAVIPDVEHLSSIQMVEFISRMKKHPSSFVFLEEQDISNLAFADRLLTTYIS